CGSYSYASANFIYCQTTDSPEIELLDLPIYDIETNQIVVDSSNLSHGIQFYDENEHILTVSRPYRGLNDCGHKTAYRLENGEFILTGFWQQGCDHSSIAPSDPNFVPFVFPQIYP
ncbi:MAG: hypothetical protein F6K30_01210, partial [Cyanothece sp. SIO2G6]|nr:hypothetical protein [Cyanothece sp. SIO2G6]